MILRTSITILVFCEALMLGMLGNDYVVPLIAMIFAFYLYVRPFEKDVSLTIKIVVPVILVGYFFFRYVSIPELVTRSEWVFPSRITVALAECFLIGQLFELIKKRDPEDGLLNFCLLAMAVIVCCCCRAASGSQRSLLFIGSVMSVTLICTIFQYSTRTFLTAKKPRKSAIAYRSVLVSATMTLVGISSWYFSGTLRDNIEGFQNWWIRNFQVAGLSNTDVSIGFSSEATLSSITDLKKSNPQDPVLHIYADAPPGYLRGRAFEKFDGFRWLRNPGSISLNQETPPSSIAENGEGFYKFASTPLNRHQKIRVDNITNKSFFFLPLNASYISGKPSTQSRLIDVDAELILLHGFSTGSIYSAYVDERPPAPGLKPSARRRLTALPSKVERGVVDLAIEVAGQEQTDAARIAAIEKHFQDNYTYSLKQDRLPRGRDRLSFFILQKPAAHCEFFASAAVVFLRANGIAARYVTGFATEELSDDEDYYVARNKDAHAWAEAYDRENNQWVIVEATPGITYPKSIWDQIADEDSAEFGGGRDFANSTVRTTWTSIFVEAWIQIREFFEEIGRQLRGPINIVIVSLIVFTLFYQYWWKRRNLPHSRSREGMLERERIKVERMLARLKLSRETNETMFQFEQRIRIESDGELAEKVTPILDWFRAYEKSRFSNDESMESIPLAPSMKA